MTRDELIEELKKAPANGDVRIKLTITPDYFEKMVWRGALKPARECYVTSAEIGRVTTIPSISIEAIT